MLFNKNLVWSFLALPVVIVTMAGCGTDDESNDYHTRGTIAGQRLTESEVRNVIKNAGFPSSHINKMVCTAWYESNWHTASRNTNHNGSVDIGLLQINSINWSWCGMSRASLENPDTNAKCGKKIFDSQGMNAWYGYKAHKAKCNAYAGGALPLFDSEFAGNGGSIVDPDDGSVIAPLPNGYVDQSDMGNGLEIPESI